MMTHSHVARLDRVWIDQPIFFITTCTLDRRPILANREMHAICREIWQNAEQLYGWIVGRYVLMPDHVHFFCAPRGGTHRLDMFVGKWKEWTSKYARRQLGVVVPLWQKEFFDHVLRSSESYEEKWQYVRANPMRAGLVDAADGWPFVGELNDLRYD